MNQIRLLDELKLDEIMCRIKYQSLSVIVYVVVPVPQKVTRTLKYWSFLFLTHL